MHGLAQVIESSTRIGTALSVPIHNIPIGLRRIGRGGDAMWCVLVGCVKVCSVCEGMMVVCVGGGLKGVITMRQTHRDPPPTHTSSRLAWQPD